MSKKIIGLSLSFCISDIVRGVIPPGFEKPIQFMDVSKIISGANVRVIEDFRVVIRRYKETYWKGFEFDAEGLACYYYIENIIEFPRTLGQQPPFIAKGHWKEVIDGQAKSESATQIIQQSSVGEIKRELGS